LGADRHVGDPPPQALGLGQPTDGAAAWRRGVYVYQRRSLPYPMFDTFDHPDMNVSAGARHVSTVPTQALTLLNNPFVLDEAARFAARVR